ncbi:MAG: response regulator [Marinoscillum sp.]
MIRGCLSIFLGFTCYFVFSQNQDSLILALEQAQGVERVEILQKLATENQYDHRNESLIYARESLELTGKVKDKNLHLKSLFLMSQISEQLSNYSDAIDYSKDALELAEEPVMIANINHHLGLTYESISEYETSLKFHLEALKIREEIGDKEKIANSFNSIAFVYRGMRQFEKAVEVLERMQVLCDEMDDPKCLARSTFNIGLMVMEMDRHAEAIPIFREAMRDLNETDHPSQFSFYYNNLANCFEKQLHINAAFYDSALYYGHKSLNLKYQVGNIRGIANTHNTLAAIYERNSDYKNSSANAKEALRLSDSLGILPIKRNALSYLITAEIKLGVIDHVNDHFEEYIDVVEELGDQVNSRNLSEMTTKYETGKKIAENEMLKSQAREQKFITLALVIGGFVLLVIVILLVFLYLLKQKSNRQLEEDKNVIQQQSTKLSELNDLKAHFFANISHELRTPLTLIQGNADAIITTPKVNPLVVEPARKIKRNVKQMSLLVNDLLDLSKLELNKKLVTLRPVMIDSVVSRVTAAFSSLADANQIRLTYSSGLSGQTMVDLDEMQFEKVLNNLIYNAFKFTPNGGAVSVKSDMVSTGVEITVTDNGTGISEKDLPYIFDRFYQAPKDNSTAGSGLGLAISKELLELMHGEISVASSDGSGTVVRLVLPVKDQNQMAGESQEMTGEEDQELLSDLKFDLLKIPSDTSVLIVEDNLLLQNYLTNILSDHFELYRAENGEEALVQLEKVRPDLILTDVMMPVMDGWELIKRLRADPALSQIPVIALTAIAENEDRLKGLRLGVDDYIIKPFEVEELLIRITNVVNNLRERIKWAREFEEDEQPIISEDNHDLAIGFRNYVKEHVADKHLNVGQLAIHLGLSERQLYRKMAESVGMSPSKVILEVRLQHARELLVSQKFEKMSQIAGEVGFESAAYFSKVYQERFGKKPSDYFS